MSTHKRAVGGMRQRVGGNIPPSSPRSADGLSKRRTVLVSDNWNTTTAKTSGNIMEKQSSFGISTTTTSSWEITSGPTVQHDHHAPPQQAPFSYPHRVGSVGRDLDRYQGLGGRLDTLVSESPFGGGGGGFQKTLSSPSLVKPRLEDVHTLYRTALHVPDSQYQNYLRGKYGRRIRDEEVMCTRTCCGKTCAGFSFVGALFLLFVGILVDTQPLYMKGTLPQVVVQADDGSKPVTQFLLPQGNERLPMAKTAYKAAFMYFLTALVSLCILYHPSFFTSFLYRRYKQYQDIPDADSTIPTFHNPAESGTSPLRGLQSNSHDSHDSVMTSSSYSPGVWSRTTARLKQWLARKGWYSAVHNKFRQRKHNPKTI